MTEQNRGDRVYLSRPQAEGILPVATPVAALRVQRLECFGNGLKEYALGGFFDSLGLLAYITELDVSFGSGEGTPQGAIFDPTPVWNATVLNRAGSGRSEPSAKKA